MQRDFKGILIPKEIWHLKDLNITEKIVLSVVNTLSEQDDGCFANNEYFAKFLNLSKGRVSKIINLLVKKGYLETNFSYYSEMRKVEKRKIKICIEGGQKEPQSTNFEVVNDQGYSQEQPYPLVENSQDIIYKYKKIIIIYLRRRFLKNPKSTTRRMRKRKYLKQIVSPICWLSSWKAVS